MTADRAGCARAEGMREPPQGGRAPSLSPAVGRGGTDVSAFRRVRGVRTTRSIIASVSLSSPRAVPHSPGSISPMMASSPPRGDPKVWTTRCSWLRGARYGAVGERRVREAARTFALRLLPGKAAIDPFRRARRILRKVQSKPVWPAAESLRPTKIYVYDLLKAVCYASP